MATDNEIQRLAAAANALRPEWPIKSLITLISRDHAARPYRDLAVALAWIATDARTKTPARLAEAGPWWTATSMTEGRGPGQSRMRCPDHPDQKAGQCRACGAQNDPKPAAFTLPPHTRPRDWTPEPVVSDLAAVRERAEVEMEETG